jgi:hypothetical protein
MGGGKSGLVWGSRFRPGGEKRPKIGGPGVRGNRGPLNNYINWWAEREFPTNLEGGVKKGPKMPFFGVREGPWGGRKMAFF